MSTSVSTAPVITPEELLHHWQGHRRLTRRVIETFPEDQLFSFSIGGMRPFGALALEMLSMAVPTVQGVVTEEWDTMSDRDVRPKADILRLWDESTEQIEALWPQIPPERFQKTMTAFGQWEMPVYALFLYVIDNEIHHRGQGYVYLRALEIEPPPFYERD
ncbi:MAG: DinB family protein [Rhodothermales bacterium]